MSSSDDSPKNPLVPSRMLGDSMEELGGRCVSCGFLVRSRPFTAEADIEVDWFTRFSDALPETWREELGDHPRYFCFLHVINMPGEIGDEMEAAGDDDWHAALRRVLWKQRQCPEWFGYCPGLGPEAHLQRYEMQRLEQDRRDFELKLAAMTQKAEEDSRLILADSRELTRDSKQLVSEIKDIAKEMKVSAKASDRFAKWVTFWIILLAVIQILVGILALTPESWRARLFRRPVPVTQPEQTEPTQR